MNRLDGKPKKTKYFGVNKKFLRAFFGCHNRVRDGKAPSIQWPRTRDGYLAFRKTIGPKPRQKGKWSVGRIKHHLGYQDGNVRWELHKFNSVKRRGTKFENSTELVVELKKLKFKKGTKEYFQHQKKIAKEYWSKSSSRKKQTETLKRLWKQGVFDNRKRKSK